MAQNNNDVSKLKPTGLTISSKPPCSSFLSGKQKCLTVPAANFFCFYHTLAIAYTRKVWALSRIPSLLTLWPACGTGEKIASQPHFKQQDVFILQPSFPLQGSTALVSCFTQSEGIGLLHKQRTIQYNGNRLLTEMTPTLILV